MASHFERLRGTGRFPHFIQIFDEDIDPDAPETRDERFEFGLDCVLDGIAARLRRDAAAIGSMITKDLCALYDPDPS